MGWMTNKLWFNSWYMQDIYLFPKHPDWLWDQSAFHSVGSMTLFLG